jgi:hypothetical protein
MVLSLNNSFVGRENWGLTAELLKEMPGIIQWAMQRGLTRLHKQRQLYRWCRPTLSNCRNYRRASKQLAELLRRKRRACTKGQK